jgi:HlyD family secretion protein
MNWPFRITVAVVALALAAGAAAAIRPRPIDVDVEHVLRAPLEQKVIDHGRARVRERYTVSVPVAGTLARIELHEGEAVEPGTVLARLLPLPSPLLDKRSRDVAEQHVASAVDTRRQAGATVARAEAAAEQARRELAKIDALVRGGASPAAQLDQATSEARIREAELSSARFSEKVAVHEIDQARAGLERFTPGEHSTDQLEITSPVHGQVLHVLRKSEGVVEAGAQLLELGDPEALELVVDVLSQDAVLVRPGMSAHALHWGGAGPLAAKVRRVEPAAFTRVSALGVEEQRVNVLLDPDGPAAPWSALGDGFAADVEITVWSRPDVVQVATSAIFREGSGWSVFVAKEGKATLRTVEIGHRGALESEIVSGLAPDEIVIIHPGASVHAGARIAWR